MDAIIIDPTGGEKGTPVSGEAAWAGAVEARSSGIFSVVRRNVVGTVNMRKSYSLAPCHHLFVSLGCKLLVWKRCMFTRWLFCALAYFLPRKGTFYSPLSYRKLT